MIKTNCFAKEIKRLRPRCKTKKKKSTERKYQKGYVPTNPMSVKNEH